MRALRFIVALTLALLLHVALAKAVFDTESPGVSTAEGSGEAGLEIGLGLAGSYTEAIAPPDAEAEPEELLTPPVETAPVPEVTAEPLPVPASTDQAPERVDAVVQQDNSAATLAAVTQPEPVPEPEPEPERAPEVPATTTPAEAPGTETASAQPPAPMQRATGTGGDRSAGGKAGDSKSYFAELMAWLNKHKRYPRDAKKEKQQGIVELQFTLQRDGSVTASSVKKSCGHAQLDQAALDMLNAAAPLPPLPASMDRQQLTLVIPIEFSLITNNRYKE